MYERGITWNVWPPELPRQARLVTVREENYRTCTFEFDLEMDARPGQFVMAWLPGLDEKPFSLAYAHPVTLTVARVGPFSSALHGLRPGAAVGLRGPFGNGFTPQGRHSLLAGGGYGVAPLAYLAQELQRAGSDVTVAIGARTAADVLLTERFERLGISPLVATEDGSLGRAGLITAIVNPLLKSGEIDCVYACGPHGMLEALETACLSHSVPAQLSWEAHMRCAVGICGSCEHRGMVVCRDGPVLPAGSGLPGDRGGYDRE